MTPNGDEELALEEGGPAWRVWLRTGLAPSDRTHLGRRALLLAALCWLPLLGSSLVDGTATGDSVRVPFLRDLAAYARFVIGIALLVFADAAVAQRLRPVLQEFLSAKLIRRDAIGAFRAAVTRARRQIDSVVVEAVLLALAYAGSWNVVHAELADGQSTWHALATDGVESLSRAGWWYALVSVPLFYFLFLRWVFRGFVWSGLLAKISRLDLDLVPTHPDRAGGLGFLSIGQAGFAILVLAASASLAARCGDEVLYQGVALESFYPTLIAFGVLALLLVLAPLLVFAPRLAALKRHALYEYGRLSSRHDGAFRDKWIADASRPQPESLLGNEDPSSLADLATGYERAKALRPLPIDVAAIAPVIVAAALPMIPLIALRVPLKEILKGLLKVVM